MNKEMQENIRKADTYLREAISIIEKISREEVANFVEVLVNAWDAGSTIYILGNGGSAKNAEHFAADLLNTTRDLEKEFPDKKIPRVRAMALTDNSARVTALINDEGWDNLFVEQLKNFWSRGDVVIALSVHGGKREEVYGARSQNILKAANFAKENGGILLSLTGFDGGALRQISDVNINVPIDSTPHTEGLHTEIFHGIIFALLKPRIREEVLRGNV